MYPFYNTFFAWLVYVWDWGSSRTGDAGLVGGSWEQSAGGCGLVKTTWGPRAGELLMSQVVYKDSQSQYAHFAPGFKQIVKLGEFTVY